MRRSCSRFGRSAFTVPRALLALALAVSALAVAPPSGAGAAPKLQAPEMFEAFGAPCTKSSGIAFRWTRYTFPGAALHHYNLYRDGALVAQPQASAVSYYSDPTLPGEYHSYVLSAVDTAGRESPRTPRASAIAYDCTRRPPPRVGALKVAVLLVNTGISKESAAQAVFVDASNVYREASWGQTWLTGDVFGPYKIDGIRKCDSMTLVSDARQAAGITRNEYDYFLLYGAGCGSRAVPGMTAFVGNPINAAHELGHVLDLDHARSSSCPVAALNDRSCTQSGNGSRFDFMGGTRELNAPHKDKLGWLHMGGVSQLLEVSQSGTYEIAPLNVAPKPGETTPHALRIITGSTTVPPSHQKYIYVEFRQVTPGKNPQGVLMEHSATEIAGYPGYPGVLAAGPNHILTYDGSYFFKPGSQLEFPRGAGAVTIKVKSVTSDRAVLHVTVT